jgi:2-dehydropantoate 2-reductase
MRVGVIGAGAIGGAIAALLARAGHEVQVTARGANLTAIREHGIRLTGVWGDYTAEVNAGSVLTRAPEFAIVATKAQDARRAILNNERLLDGIPIAVVQNGLGGVSSSRPLLPRSDVVGALALYASSLVAPGEIAVGTAGHTYIGGGGDVPGQYVARILNEVMPTGIQYNFVGAQWTKLVINQVNALPAITGLSVQEVIGIPALRRILTLSMRENVRTGARSGVRFAEIQGLTQRRLRFFLRSPLWAAESLPRLMARRMGSVPNPGSTLQSIRRGGMTEVDYLNGAVVEAAVAIGRTAPLNTAMVELVHQVEQTREFLTPDEVVRRILAVGPVASYPLAP